MSADSNENKPRQLSKKHEARLEKENKQRKIIRIGVIAVVAAVVILIVYGVLDSTVLKNTKPVAKVGSTTITVEQFQKRVKFDRQQYVSQYMTYATSNYAYFFQSSLQSVQNSLDNYVQFGSDILDEMINEAVIVQKAKELGITVTDEEVQKELEANFYFYPDGTPPLNPPEMSLHSNRKRYSTVSSRTHSHVLHSHRDCDGDPGANRNACKYSHGYSAYSDS